MRSRSFGPALAAGTLALGVLALSHPALAQAHNPFGVGISEGGGSAGGFTGWLLGVQAVFERQLAVAVRASAQGGASLWGLVGLSFAYGVFHAAGPGHGKAVMTSYLFANERALRRGLVLTALAAVLQGLVAVGLVGILAWGLHATAARMKAGASLVESLSYAGIALLGAWLVWRKGRALWAALRENRAGRSLSLAFASVARPPVALAAPQLEAMPQGLAFSSVERSDAGLRGGGLAGLGDRRGAGGLRLGLDPACGCPPAGTFSADAAHAADCSHFHAPDPRRLGEGFSWREAVLTVAAAGSRPCSGAILVLVFALAQGVFLTGILAVAAMSLGTALTTGVLATLAVAAKALTLRLTGGAGPGRRGVLVARALEFLAALVVLVAGLSLFLGYTALGGA